MVTRQSCAVGLYGIIEFLGMQDQEGSFIFTLDQRRRLAHNHVRRALDEFTEDWVHFGQNESGDLVFVVKTDIQPSGSPEHFLQSNLVIVAQRLAEKLDLITGHVMMAQQMRDPEERLVPVC